MHNVDFRSKEFDKKQDVIKEKDFIFFSIWHVSFLYKIMWACVLCLNIGSGADTGGGGAGDIRPPEFGIFCSYFQNSFSIACLRERNSSAKQEKFLS